MSVLRQCCTPNTLPDGDILNSTEACDQAFDTMGGVRCQRDHSVPVWGWIVDSTAQPVGHFHLLASLLSTEAKASGTFQPENRNLPRKSTGIVVKSCARECGEPDAPSSASPPVQWLSDFTSTLNLSLFFSLLSTCPGFTSFLYHILWSKHYSDSPQIPAAPLLFFPLSFSIWLF